jgi:pimeloyl-ACP methyl ester carboxylesterase
MQSTTIETAALAFGCEISGPQEGRPVILLDGWPDDVRTWDRITPALHAAGLRNDRLNFTRHLWTVWNPNWRISDEEFSATAASFENPDWADIVLHSYRVRWGLAPTDPAYQAIETKLAAEPTIIVPTLVIHGGSDPCNDPSTSQGKEHFFAGPYQRLVLDRVGHFPQREAPKAVAEATTRFLTS